jgi:transcriptional regulator with GAF, ATPase, and Fis domain
LKDFSNYDSALEKIIQFAVDQTGAERGVLLLCSKDSKEFQVKSFINCDEASIQDIKEFSKNIPHLVLGDAKPLIVDNAVKDKRTKDFKSVIAHNIRSVMCIPISGEEQQYGVLYLDHHTIPALFEDSDITFVSSLANFISVMLSAINELRTASITSDELHKNLETMGVGRSYVTRDESMESLLERLPEIARTNASVLLIGESGTGKEVMCQMIHDLSLRSDKPLVRLNCAAISRNLIESELFGVARGAATGVVERDGRFSAADGGTLFLDEVGDMPIEIQAKVLRVLEYQQFEKVGSNRTISSDIRFIYATNKDLGALVEKQEFREDLYYRINTITVEIPPLRDRSSDIIPLINHFMGLFSRDTKGTPQFTETAYRALISYRWPGNVREVRNLVERLCILYPRRLLKVTDLPSEITKNFSTDETTQETAEAFEKARTIEALTVHNWNQSRAADFMKMPLTTFRRKMKKYNISKPL